MMELLTVKVVCIKNKYVKHLNKSADMMLSKYNSNNSSIQKDTKTVVKIQFFLTM